MGVRQAADQGSKTPGDFARIAVRRHVSRRAAPRALAFSCGLWGLLVVVVLAFAQIPSRAAEPLTTQNPYKVKAAYLFNFAKYVEWPGGASNSAPIRIGVLGTDPFGAVLDRTVEGRAVFERPVEVVRSATLDGIMHCQIVFVASSEANRLTDHLAALRGRPILLVGEQPDFLDRGGMIQFGMKQDRVVFDVALTRARAARLNVRSRMLELANRVIVTDMPLP